MIPYPVNRVNLGIKVKFQQIYFYTSIDCLQKRLIQDKKKIKPTLQNPFLF